MSAALLRSTTTAAERGCETKPRGRFSPGGRSGRTSENTAEPTRMEHHQAFPPSQKRPGVGTAGTAGSGSSGAPGVLSRPRGRSSRNCVTHSHEKSPQRRSAAAAAPAGTAAGADEKEPGANCRAPADQPGRAVRTGRNPAAGPEFAAEIRPAGRSGQQDRGMPSTSSGHSGPRDRVDPAGRSTASRRVLSGFPARAAPTRRGLQRYRSRKAAQDPQRSRTEVEDRELRTACGPPAGTR